MTRPRRDKRISIRLSAKLLRALKLRAAAEQRSIGGVVNKLLAERLLPEDAR